MGRLKFQKTNKQFWNVINNKGDVIGTIEIVGYRQVCSNGMKIRVPLEQAEFVRPELKIEIQRLLSMSASVCHIGDVEEKIKADEKKIKRCQCCHENDTVEKLCEKCEKMRKAIYGEIEVSGNE